MFAIFLHNLRPKPFVLTKHSSQSRIKVLPPIHHGFPSLSISRVNKPVVPAAKALKRLEKKTSSDEFELVDCQLVVFANLDSNQTLFYTMSQTHIQQPLEMERSKLDKSIWISEVLQLPAGQIMETTVFTAERRGTLLQGFSVMVEMLKVDAGMISTLRVDLHHRPFSVTSSHREVGAELCLTKRLVDAALRNIWHKLCAAAMNLMGHPIGGGQAAVMNPMEHPVGGQAAAMNPMEHPSGGGGGQAAAMNPMEHPVGGQAAAMNPMEHPSGGGGGQAAASSDEA